MYKNVVKICALIAIVVILVVSSTAVCLAYEIDGVEVSSVFTRPEECEIEITYEKIHCPSVEALSIRDDGWFAILYNRTIATVGRLDWPEKIYYVSIFNALGEQQFTLEFENLVDAKLELTDNRLFICLFPTLIEFDLQSQSAITYHELSEEDTSTLLRKWNVNEREPMINGWKYFINENGALVREKNNVAELVLETNHKYWMGFKLGRMWIVTMSSALLGVAAILGAWWFWRKKRTKQSNVFTIEIIED